MLIDRPHFFSSYRQKWGRLTQSQTDGLTTLLSFIENDPYLSADARWVAYFLATVKHETADTWLPITERGSKAYFIDHCWKNTRVARALGNQSITDAAVYRGRGYVQITGRRNYQKFSDLLDINLITAPELANDPQISYRIASRGMVKGLFTGKSLAEFINATMTDFPHARKIINGMDRAALVAGYAKFLQGML